MARIKHTKTELKAQSDALRRYRHFLPMLLLKKQQLQAEIVHVDTRIEAVRRQEADLRAQLENWIGLMADGTVDLKKLVVLESVETDVGNIAGVAIPVFKRIRTTRARLDLFATDPWLDDAQEALEALLACRAEVSVLDEERLRIVTELRVTAQRVNLFEKVKIPECRENIRTIRIFLGDEQTAAVARGKMAKARTAARREREAVA